MFLIIILFMLLTLNLYVLKKLKKEELEVLPLHHHVSYMEACCKLINSEWKRSDSARMWSLQASCDNFPTCLVMIYNGSEVVGHSKLTLIPSLNCSCFVESVVIGFNHRRKGWGKYLMIKSEEYALSRGIVSVYLSTHGQEEFYRKLGYSECSPVNVFGAPLTPPSPQIQTTFSLSAPRPPPLLSFTKSNDTVTAKPKKTFMQKQIVFNNIS